VPAYPEPEAVGHMSELAALPNSDDQAQGLQARDEKRSGFALRKMPGEPQVDSHWQEKYSHHLWFQFTPAQVAAWYNERHKVQALLPPEKNGLGLASWRGEHTASVGLREDGWVDFGASARCADGKQDGGDALELRVRVTEEAKPEVMREIARQLVSEAREAMESAAQRGEQPPPWVQAFMSPAGWQRYRQLREEAGHGNQAITASAASLAVVAGSCTKSLAQAVPAGRNEIDEKPEALAAVLGAIIGEPCKKCGCTLYYQSGPYRMCHWCLPPRLNMAC
jgi:hypothetical protein